MATPGDNKRDRSVDKGCDDESASTNSLFEVDDQTLSLADILARCSKETTATVAAQIAKLSAEFNKSIEAMAKSLDQRSEQRFGKMEGEIDDLRKSQRRLETENQQIRSSIESLSGALAVAEKNVAEGVTDTQLARDDFQRKPDPNILLVSTHYLAKLDDIKKATEKWLEDANLLAKVTYMGQETGKRFTLGFGADIGAARRVRMARDALRTPGGGWREFKYRDVDGTEHNSLFVSIDKSKFQQKREFDTRRLTGILNSRFGRAKIAPNKIDGQISFHGVPLVFITPTNEELPSNIQWNLEHEKIGEVDKQAIINEFHSLPNSRASRNSEIQWSQV